MTLAIAFSEPTGRAGRAPSVVGGGAAAIVLVGEGGSGKTRAAIEFAYRHAREYIAILFVRAHSSEALTSNLAALCEPGLLDLPEQDASEVSVQAAAALEWLRLNPGWLLILDDVVTEPTARAAVEALAPLTRMGHVLITSRLNEWSNIVRRMSVGNLTEADSACFVLERTDGQRCDRPDDSEQARAVAGALGGLPLALELASAAIAASHGTIADFLKKWRSAHEQIVKRFDDRVSPRSTAVSATFRVSILPLAQPSRRLLCMLIWFAPDPIPLCLLDTPPPVAGSALPGGVFSLHAALLDLEALSLVTRAIDAPMFYVHRALRNVVRESLDDEELIASLTAALNWVKDGFAGDPYDARYWSELMPLAPHARACAEFADQVGIGDPTARVFSRVGSYFYARALYSETEPLYRRALAIDERAYGPEHPDVARDLNNLAQLLHDSSRLAEAEPLIRRVICIFETSLGISHPNVAATLNSLAELLQATNRLSEAEELMRRALAIDEASFGPDHARIAKDLNSLAMLLQATKRPLEAEVLMRRVVSIFESSLGSSHPNVATAVSNLAELYLAMDRLSEAEPLLRRALSIDERIYGPDHPEVAIRLNNLGQLLQGTDRLYEAELLLRRAIEVDEAAYGPDDPVVATDLNNIAALLQATDRLAEAESFLRRALSIWEQALGHDHPNVATALNNLASLYQSTDRLLEAEALMLRALAIDELVYGAEHPEVAIRLNNLAQLLQSTNRLSEAQPLMRRHLMIFVNYARSTGQQHPYLEAAETNYRVLLLNMGHSEQQITEMIREIMPHAPAATVLKERRSGPR